MNPTFTVSIDTEKRKASAAGLVAVGEKVDVVVTGLDATQIPEWEQDNDEGFMGPSLRFRLVAPNGKDLVRFPLAEGDAWTIGAEGELTAEVDFNTMPLRHWFHGYEIGAKAEVGMILDSVVDAMEYGRGTVKVLQWTASPAEDPTILPDWRKTLRDLNAAIVEIKDSVDLAEGYANDAEASAGVATEKAGVAVTAANNALSSKSAAEGFKSDAQNAANDALGYKDDAETAADTATTKAEEAAGSAGEAAQILEDIEAAIVGKAEQSDLEAEVTRATQKEEALEDGLTEANDAISDNADAIDQLEENKADKTALDTLSDAIDSEAETREEKDAAICAKLNKEIADRQDADNLKADKATTYTKTEVDTKIAGVQTFQKYLVQTLPDPDEADMKGLYLVPTGETSEEGDLCEEWTVVEEDGEKRWELIGGTTVDLSNYYDKDAVDGLLAGKEPLLGPLLISGSTIKTVSAIVKNGSSLYPIGIPTSDITVNGKALANDVTLTGADIAVSGTDTTKIDAVLAGKATKADATLTERFGAWTLSGDVEAGRQYEVRFDYDNEGTTLWALYQDGYLFSTGSDDPLSTSEDFPYGLPPEAYTITATRTALQGYQLGSQTDKPLASDSEVVHTSGDTMTGTLILATNTDVPGIRFNRSNGYSKFLYEGGDDSIQLWTVDSNGNVVGSISFPENKFGILALKGNIPYDLGTPTVINTASSETVEGETVYYGAATLANRTANIVQVTAATALDELRITFPAATSGKVRDFGLRVEIGTGSAALTAPALVPIAPTGETIKIENNAAEIPALADGTATAKGVTLLYFSETAPGVFVVKGEQVEEVA